MADRGLPTRGVIGVLVVVALALVGLNLNAMQATDYGSSRNMKSNWLERMAPAERSHAFSGLMKDEGEECAAVSRFYFRGRSEDRRGGKEGVSTCKSRWPAYPNNIKKRTTKI